MYNICSTIQGYIKIKFQFTIFTHIPHTVILFSHGTIQGNTEICIINNVIFKTKILNLKRSRD